MAQPDAGLSSLRQWSSESAYDQEAQRVMRRLKQDSRAAAGGGDADAVWVHPETNATLLIGNIAMASDRDKLLRSGIRCIVNCMDSSEGYFYEGDREFSYLRFPITRWSSQPSVRTDAGILAYFAPLFGWIDAKLDRGENVLVHCIAGAHRGGTAGTAFVMYKSGLGAEGALSAVRRARPFVDPIFDLRELLERLERALQAEAELGYLECT